MGRGVSTPPHSPKYRVPAFGDGLDPEPIPRHSTLGAPQVHDLCI